MHFVSWSEFGPQVNLLLGPEQPHLVSYSWCTRSTSERVESTMWINQNLPFESTRIHPDPSLGPTRMHYWDPPVSTTWIYHQDPLLEATRIYFGDLPRSTPWIHLDSLMGSTRIHQWDPLGSTTWIHHLDPPGSTNVCFPDPPLGSTTTLIHQDPLPGSIAGIHKDPPPGSTRIIERFNHGSTTSLIHQDPLPGFTRIPLGDQQGSTTYIH